MKTLLVAIAAVAAVMVAGEARAEHALIPAQWRSCGQVNSKYPHGVGKLGAHDRTTSGPPVTTFKRSNRLYGLAMRYNRGLDRDHDGVACERQ